MAHWGGGLLGRALCKGRLVVAVVRMDWEDWNSRAEAIKQNYNIHRMGDIYTAVCIMSNVFGMTSLPSASATVFGSLRGYSRGDGTVSFICS